MVFILYNSEIHKEHLDTIHNQGNTHYASPQDPVCAKRIMTTTLLSIWFTEGGGILDMGHQAQLGDGFVPTCWPASYRTLECQSRPFPRPDNRPYILWVITVEE